ncbi:hypothetical protein [Acinetobacter soli]|uniref:hypothetical protein n=1 Tax=Acinetobacter soli TaxID=487316 RepID=UPI00124F7811|nr:hypothetical protein [Acinetobacter soli]
MKYYLSKQADILIEVEQIYNYVDEMASFYRLTTHQELMLFFESIKDIDSRNIVIERYSIYIFVFNGFLIEVNLFGAPKFKQKKEFVLWMTTILRKYYKTR